MFKSNKGFTLVELIVVIAILGILAGVAIPAYSGYINKANDASVLTELDAIQTAAQAANAVSGEVTIIVVDGSTIKVGGNGNKLSGSFDSDFCLFYNATDASTTSLGVLNATVELKGTYAEGATWKDGKWTPGTENVPDQEAGVGGNVVTTPAPEVSTTPAPEVSTTPAPEVSTTPAPEVSDDPAPAVSGDALPVG